MISRLLFSLALAALNVSPVFALEVPKLERRVTDLAGLLAAQEIQNLEAKVQDLELTDSTQIAVLIIPTLEGEVLEDYSHRVASTWGLGQKGRENGALLLIAMKERRIRIEVGYGLEGRLTDALSRRIIEDHIVPDFRQGEFYRGIDSGVTAMIQVVRGAYQAPSRRQPTGRVWGLLGGLLPIVLVTFWIIYASRKWGRRRRATAFPYGWSRDPLTGIWILGGMNRPRRSKGSGSFMGGGFGGFGGGFGGAGLSGGGGSFGGGGASGKW